MLGPVTRSLAPLLLSTWWVSTTAAAFFELPIWFKNTYAIVEAEIGTPQQKHFLLFDTGSSTTWLVDKNCADGECQNSSGYPWNGYDQNASSTSESLGTYDKIVYLGGVTSGFGVSDVFSLPSAANFTWNQTFMSANESSWFWIPCDGFLGLAFSSVADANTTTLVETLMQDGALDEPRFGIYYGKEFNDTGDTAGEGVLTIGASEEEKYVEGNLTWISLQLLSNKYQVWRTDMWAIHGITLDNGSVVSDQANYFNGAWAVFDTGAGGITVPPSEVEDIYKSIGMNYTAILKGDHLPLCTEFNSSWAVEFEFGSYREPVTVRMTGDQLARPGFAYQEKYCYPPFDEGVSEGLFLFGTSFLHQFYSVYDFGASEVANYDPRVGLGKLKDEWKPTAWKRGPYECKKI